MTPIIFHIKYAYAQSVLLHVIYIFLPIPVPIAKAILVTVIVKSAF